MAQLAAIHEPCPSVLVAYPPGPRADEIRSALRLAGFDVGGCDGPTQQGSCALIDENAARCTHAAGVDAVVLGVVDDPRTDDLFFALRQRHRDALIVVFDARLDAAIERATDRAALWRATVARLIDEIERRLGRDLSTPGAEP
jgi:hypothetical protein